MPRCYYFRTLAERSPSLPSSLHRLPEVIRVKEPGEFGVDVDNVHVTFLTISDYGFAVISCLIRFDVDAERSVDFES